MSESVMVLVWRLELAMVLVEKSSHKPSSR